MIWRTVVIGLACGAMASITAPSFTAEWWVYLIAANVAFAAARGAA